MRKIFALIVFLSASVCIYAQNWVDFEEKNLELDYFIHNGSKGNCPEETWGLSEFNDLFTADIYLCGMQGRGFNHGYAIADGVDLFVSFDNKSKNTITITRYDSTNSKLYTKDSYGTERVFNVRPARYWEEFFDCKLNLYYWRIGDRTGTVNGEVLKYTRRPSILSGIFANYEWTGMSDNGEEMGLAGLNKDLILLISDGSDSDKLVRINLIAYDYSENILYAYSKENKLLRAFKTVR